MTIRDLVPAKALAQRFGVKGVIYGPPGSGKTPLIGTLAPLNPVVCVTEPGMLSMRTSEIACFPAFTPDAVRDFMRWAVESAEARQFGVKVIDSSSQMAELFLEEALGKKTQKGNDNHGKRAYGEMATECMKVFNNLYFAPQMHVILVVKEDVGDNASETKKRPYFPGRELNIKVPHLFDEVLRLDRYLINGQPTRALQTQDSFAAFARERSGSLAEYEPPDLSYIINKIMAAI